MKIKFDERKKGDLSFAVFKILSALANLFLSAMSWFASLVLFDEGYPGLSAGMFGLTIFFGYFYLDKFNDKTDYLHKIINEDLKRERFSK